MAEHNFGQFLGAHKIEFNVTLKHLDTFKEFNTETFSVAGNLWTVSFERYDVSHEGIDYDYLGIHLHAENGSDADDWTIVAGLKAEMISTELNADRHAFDLRPLTYDNKFRFWGRESFILWNELMDLKQGYVHNNSCKIAVKINASPIQNVYNDQMFEFHSINKYCDSLLNGEFRIKIKNVHEFFDVSSPEFTLGNFPWRFLVHQSGKSPEKFLQMLLFNPMMTKETEKSCKVSLTCQLISNNPNDDGVQKTMDNQQFEFAEFDCFLKIISWEDLLNPDKKFVRDNSFELHVKLTIVESNGQGAIKRGANDGGVKCAKCSAILMGQSSYMLACAHVVCEPCSEQAEKNKVCTAIIKNDVACNKKYRKRTKLIFGHYQNWYESLLFQCISFKSPE